MDGILDPEYFNCCETEMVLKVKRLDDKVALSLRGNSIHLNQKELESLLHQLSTLDFIIKRDFNNSKNR